MADAGILRLYNFLSWVKEMIELRNKKEFRTKNDNTFADNSFLNEMNRLINLSSKHYEQLLFKEALKSCFFEYQIARDNYKQLCGGNDKDMREDLVFRFIETQALILSPICPHICEKIWQLLEKVFIYSENFLFFIYFFKNELIVSSKWPKTDFVDELLVQKSEFLHRTIREFRLRREGFLNSKKKRNNKVEMAPSIAVTSDILNATVYIAERQPKWKLDILNIIKEVYEVNIFFFI